MLEEALKVLDGQQLKFSESSLLIMNITLALIMFGVALEIKIENFKAILKNPKSIILGVISQFILLPGLTFLLVLILRPTPSVALGMILVSVCPGGNISNFISATAKANIALSVSLTAFATVAAIIITPLNFSFWGKMYEAASHIILPISIDPLKMIFVVVLILGIPLALGMWFSNKFPKTTAKINKPMKILSLLIFAGYVFGALAANFDLFLQFVHLVIFIVLIHNALALLTGFGLATIFRLPRPDRRTITIETGIQNSGLALVLIFTIFEGKGGMAFIAACWGIWHILSGLAVAFIWSKKPLNN